MKMLLFIAVCWMCMFNSLLAAEVEQDGLRVTLTGEAKETDNGTEIQMSIEIVNQNETKISELQIETIAPEGYELMAEEERILQVDTLQGQETATGSWKLLNKKEVAATPKQEKEESPKQDVIKEETPKQEGTKPQTGDSENAEVWISCIVISAVGMIVILAWKYKQGKKILSLILCVTMTGGMLGIMPMKAEAQEVSAKTLTIVEIVVANETEVEVSVKLTYEKPELQIPEEIALLYGIDPYEEDSDGDGLSNYIEIYTSETNPTLADTDSDGVNDLDEDLDEDGLTNCEELELGTAIDKADTDKDGLDDKEEKTAYNTNPLLSDTDNDLLCDGDEIILGLDPLLPKTDKVTPDAERKIKQKLAEENISEEVKTEENTAVPSLVLNACGNINKKVFIDVTDSNVFGDSRALVGKAIDILGTCIEEGTLRFELKETSGACESYVICYYKEDGTTEYLTTQYDAENKTVFADIYSEGTYFVMDVQSLMNELAVFSDGKVRMAQREAMAPADIVFVIDSTGSMGDEILNVKENANAFVQTLRDKGVSAALALVTFEDLEYDGYDSTRIHKNGASNWFYDMNAYGNVLVNMPLGRGGDLPECALDALETARLIDMRESAGKVFILITDADYKVDNQYEIPSMDAEIELLKNAGVSCSVISAAEHHEIYKTLYESTNGIWSDITGDFHEELQGIADKVGTEIVGEGYWIYLDGPIPVPVRLDEKPTPGSQVDTDKDGIIDIDELESTTPTGSINLDELLTQVSHGSITGTNYGTVMMYKYRSNPVEKDTDYDGVDDTYDTAPNNNIGRGIMHFEEDETARTCNIEFKMDYRQLMTGDNTVYSKDLSMLSILYASDVYEGTYIEVTEGPNVGGNDNGETFGGLLGLQDSRLIHIKGYDYSVDKDDVTDFYVGHKRYVYNGEEHEIIIASIRGTNGTNEEWSSNFDVGADTSEYYAATGNYHPHWVNKQHHKGFDVAANRVLERLNGYIDTYVNKNAKKTILLTGHSRGAAIANLLGKHFEDDPAYRSFTYTYAAPNSTTMANTSSYRTIFNVVNTDDLITYLPLENWGFSRYGTTKAVCVEDYYENEVGEAEAGSWEWFIGEDYNNDGGTQTTLKAIQVLVNNREDLYVLETADIGKVWEDDLGHITYAGAEEELAELTRLLEQEKLLKFCNIYIVGSFIYHVEINYCGAYLLQTLANMVTGVGPMLGRDVAGKYADAKTAFVASSGEVGIGGMTHPHMQATYYIIAYHNCESLY